RKPAEYAKAATEGESRKARNLPTTNSQQPTALLHSIRSLPNQRQELLASLFLIAEAAKHRRGHGGRMLFFHAAHHHAKMPCLDDYADSLRLDNLLDSLGNLRREALLNLQAAGKDFNQARNFA